MLKKSQVMGERSWTAEVAILRICGGISDVGSSVMGKSRLRAIRQKLTTKEKDPVFVGAEDKERMEAFISLVNERLPTRINTLDLHPVGWYLLLKKYRPNAIHPRFDKSILKIFNSDAESLVVQTKKVDEKKRNWSKLTTLSKMQSKKSPKHGQQLNWFLGKVLDDKMESYIWRVCSASEARKKNEAVVRPATRVEKELEFAIAELRMFGLQQQIKALKTPNKEGPLFITNAFQRNDFYLLLKATVAGNKLLKRVSVSTIKASLSKVILTKRGRQSGKHESFVNAEFAKMLQDRFRKGTVPCKSTYEMRTPL